MALYHSFLPLFRTILTVVSGCVILLQVIRRLPGNQARVSFGALNFAATFMLFRTQSTSVHSANTHLAAYFMFTSVHFLLTRVLSRKGKRVDWIPVFFPILALLSMKLWSIAGFIGVSYMVFRLSQLALEYRNDPQLELRFWDYQGFAFFPPTLIMGPISSFRTYLESILDIGKFRLSAADFSDAAFRCLTGLVKVFFLANLCKGLSFSGLLLDSRTGHSILDFFYASAFYYFYLYCDFSGFIDIMIGLSRLIGIKVDENFDHPFRSRNVKDFWNRWHITLSVFMRNMVFSPLSSALARKVDGKYVNHVIPLAIAPVFLLIGFWHGTGWNYILFGAVHALGVVGNHYYSLFLKKMLSREQFRSYNKSEWIRAASVALTFLYVSTSFFFFANNMSQMEQIKNAFK